MVPCNVLQTRGHLHDTDYLHHFFGMGEGVGKDEGMVSYQVCFELDNICAWRRGYKGRRLGCLPIDKQKEKCDAYHDSIILA